MARERLRLQEVGDEADGQPTYLFPDYRSTLLRAPTKPLAAASPDAVGADGPVFGDDAVDEHDHDLTQRHGGEPLGERIVVSGRVLAEALVQWYRARSTALLDACSETCLRRAWRAEHFSCWMTSMLHRLPDADPFDLKLQLSQLRYVVSSHAAAAGLAENYVGLDRV